MAPADPVRGTVAEAKGSGVLSNGVLREKAPHTLIAPLLRVTAVPTCAEVINEDLTGGRTLGSAQLGCISGMYAVCKTAPRVATALAPRGSWRECRLDATARQPCEHAPTEHVRARMLSVIKRMGPKQVVIVAQCNESPVATRRIGLATSCTQRNSARVPGICLARKDRHS